jgi:hypothetical protein
VNTWSHFTVVDPRSGGLYNTMELARRAGFSTKQSFIKARKKYPGLEKTVHAFGEGRYRIYAAYTGSLDVIAGTVKQEAQGRQMEPLRKSWTTFVSSRY